MAKNKTVPTDESVTQFIEQIPDQQKRVDSYKLIEIMEEITAQPATLWGPSIIGFGSYHYKYASGHEGDAPLVGFSPRKPAISLYLYTCDDEQKYDLEQLGKYKMSKSCIYVKRLSDIDEAILRKILEDGVAAVKKKYS